MSVNDRDPSDLTRPDRVRRRPILLVAAREIRASLGNRSTWIGFSIAIVAILAISILPGLFSSDRVTTHRIGLTGTSTALAEPLAAIDDADPDRSFEIVTVDGEAAARSGVLDGDLDAAVVDGTILVEDDLDPLVGASIDQAARTVRIEAAVADGLLDPASAEELASPTVLGIDALDPTDEEQAAREAMTAVGMLLVFAQILTFGYAVAGGIVEEKSSRVVEILLSKVRTSELLAGKVLGVFVVTTAQLIVFAAVGLFAATASGTLDLPTGWFGVVATLFAWYLVAFAFYGAVFAIGGALAASAEEMQSTLMPATMLIMIAYFAGMLTLGSPESTVARIASFVPPTAPLAMPIRATLSDVATWQVAAAVGAALVASLLLIPFAARVYRGTVLQTRRTGIGTALRNARAR